MKSSWRTIGASPVQTFLKFLFVLGITVMLLPSCSGNQCTKDDQCEAGKSCVEGQCKATEGCKSDKDCKDGQTCNKSKCEDKKEGCASDDDCTAPTALCDTTSKKCVGCLKNDDCKGDNVCLKNECKPRPECLNDKDCTNKSKKHCSDAGKCEWNCKEDSDCSLQFQGGGICDNHECKPKPDCTSDSDCKGKNKPYCSKEGRCELDCKEDSHCKGKSSPFCSSAGTCTWNCKENSDCKDSKVCVGHQCQEKGAACTSNTDCQSGQVCWKSRCFDSCAPPKPCKDTTQNCIPTGPGTGACLDGCSDAKPCPDGYTCDAVAPPLPGQPEERSCSPLPAPPKGKKQLGETCHPTNPALQCDGSKDLTCFSSGGLTCQKACNFSKGAKNNSDCKSGEECVRSTLSHKGGACLPAPTQKEGEICGTASRCVTGLRCNSLYKRCEKTCLKNSDCGNDSYCVSRVCKKKCDPSKGTDTNPACPGRCRANATLYKPGYCEWYPPSKPGQKKEGESCSPLSNAPPAESCDGSKKLYCMVLKGRVCGKGCDLKKGATNNADCGGGSCVPDSFSPWGGRCVAVGTAKEGEVCDPVKKGCVSGLTCSNGRCAVSCDPKKPQPDVCGSTQYCFSNVLTGNICVDKCDPDKAVLGNSACKTNYYCQKYANTPGLKGYCRPLPGVQQGPKKAGEACSSVSSTRYCDGSKGLVCSSLIGFRCVQQCDPLKGKTSNASCATGETCEVDATSSPKGGSCVQLCDMANGSVTNKDCKVGTYCRAGSSLRPSHCTPLPAKPTGTRKKGEACSPSSPTMMCNGSQDLTCSLLGGTFQCATACDPRKGQTGNAACGRTEECFADTNSYLGGSCHAKATQKEGEVCGTQSGPPPPPPLPPPPVGTVLRCVTGLSCYQTGKTTSRCLKSCTPGTSGQCPQGSICRPIASGGGACDVVRKQSRKTGETCLGDDPSKADYHNCEKGLGCDSTTKKCVTGEKKYSSCGGTTKKTCSSDYVCAGSNSTRRYYCLDTCNPKASSPCGAGFTCLGFSSTVIAAGACLQNCKVDSDCKNYGSKCLSFGTAGRFCN